MRENDLKWNKPWILQRADPYVYRHVDGSYYFTASVPAYDSIVLRDLLGQGRRWCGESTRAAP